MNDAGLSSATYRPPAAPSALGAPGAPVASDVSERALSFGCGADTLLGVLAQPSSPAAVGVVIVVGGPQYRAGSHRQFVLLARALAGAGFATLRFDVRGMGDSSGEPRGFEAIREDIGAAIQAFTGELPSVGRIVLWGLCDGAAAALLYLDERPDPRVVGLCLANPWVRTQASLAKTHVKHYYLQRLAERSFWTKLLKGKIAHVAIAELMRNLARALGQGSPVADRAAPSYVHRMARAWTAFGGSTLLLLSRLDYTAREFEEVTAADPDWRRALAAHPPRRVDVEGADHTFSLPGPRVAAERATVDWLSACFGPTQP